MTALDVWATKERWRFEVPPVHLLRRGGRDDDPVDPHRLLPLVVPGAGRRAPAHERGGRTDGALRSAGWDRDDGAHRRANLRGHAVVASRLAGGSLDRLEFRGASLGLHPGDRAVYDEEPSGVHVEVTVESAADAPDPGAFVDPDAPPEPAPPGSAS